MAIDENTALDDYVAQVLADAPPLTDEKRDRITRLFGAVSVEVA